MSRRGPGPLAVVHPLLIVTAILAVLGYAVREIAAFRSTGEREAAVGALLAVAAAVGLGIYLRSLRGLAARLTPRTKLALVLGLLLPATVHAGSITLETTLSSQVGEAVRVTVLVRNTGSDVAHDVKPRILLGDASQAGELVRELAPQRRNEWTFDVARPARPGRYPLLATVAYNDAGFRGFSAVSAVTVDVEGAAPPALQGSLSSVALSGEGNVTLNVTNAASAARDVRLGLFLPDELGGWRDLGTVRLEAGKSRAVDARVQNAGALAGSRYAIYGVARVAGAERDTAQLFAATATVTQTRAIDWQGHLTEIALYLGAAFLLLEAALRALAARRGPQDA
ncbi:MAG: hypothetical protein U0807_14965 [Candidatus Binatia bacterium]